MTKVMIRQGGGFMMQHMVRRGDSLWGLACQYLGSGARWREIEKFHNEMALGGKHPRLLPIEDNDLIFVGQMIAIPPRNSRHPTLSQAPLRDKSGKNPPSLGTRTKDDLQVGRFTSPIHSGPSALHHRSQIERNGRY